MANEQKAFDGHTRVYGVDTSVDPSENTPSFLSGAVNRTFRGGLNKTRPAFEVLEHHFDGDESKEIFQKGCVNGVFSYQKWRNGGASQLVFSIHDRLMVGTIVNNQISIRTLKAGLSPGYMRSWGLQVMDRFYWQNGVDDPVGWDGDKDVYSISGFDRMPKGTAMGFCNGRIIVHTSDNWTIIGDHIYGNGLKDTKGGEKFIEYQQFNDLGALGVDATLGPIAGGISIPKSATANFQGEYLILCENGAVALNLTGAREDWLTGDTYSTVLKGRGAIASSAIHEANSDIWFLTSEGSISSYRVERSEREKAWGDTSLSREVDLYLGFTSRHHRQFCSMVLHNNRLLTSCGISVKPGELGGMHRYGEGIVALDFDKGSTTNQKSGFGWDGLWTGLNVVQMTRLEGQCYAVSHDRDGINRVYEITDKSKEDLSVNGRKAIVSFYDTPYLFEPVEVNEPPRIRELMGARMLFSDVNGKSKVSAYYRADYFKEWNEFMRPIDVGYNPPKKEPFDPLASYEPLAGEIQTPAPNPKCGKHKGQQFQVRVKAEGRVTFPMLQVECGLTDHSPRASCNDSVSPLLLSKRHKYTPDELFSYKIS
jgi:hypothetical protein